MAVIPSLAVMAGLTLLFNPGAQPEGAVIDTTPMQPFAIRLQRAWRRFIKRGSTPVRRIQRVWKGFSVRGNLPWKWVDTPLGQNVALSDTRFAVSDARRGYQRYQRGRRDDSLLAYYMRSRVMQRLN